MKKNVSFTIETSIYDALDEMSKKNGVSKSSLIEDFILKNLDLSSRENLLVDEKYLGALNFFHLKPKKSEIKKLASEYPTMSYFLSSKSKLFKSVIPKGKGIEVVLKKSINPHLIEDSFFEGEEDFLEKILGFMKIFDEEREMEKEKEIKKLENELF